MWRHHKQSTDELHRWRSQQLDGTSTWDTGNGSLTDSTRWGSRRGGVVETGGREVSSVDEQAPQGSTLGS